MARAILELIGDADSLVKEAKRSDAAIGKLNKGFKELGVTAEQSARAQVQAAVRRDARLRGEISVYRQVAQAAKKGSREQVAAANLATRAEERLARSLAVTSREAKEHARSLARSERQLGKLGRGAFAGSGLAGGLGRTLAFASGGFLASASITAVLRDSITEGQEAAVVQRQLAAQFRAAGQDLSQYQSQIDSTTNSLSNLVGIEDDELKAAFVTAFRGTQNVATGLKIQAIAADVSKARNISLATSTVALTKAFLGQTTALKRLGVNVPATLHGMEALNFVQAKFAGQAVASTTSQDRFAVAIKNTEQIIGTALLPTVNKLLDSLSNWLAKTENQEKIQRVAEGTVKKTSAAARILGNAWKLTGPLVDQAKDQYSELGLAIKAAGVALQFLNRESKKFKPSPSPIPENASVFRPVVPGTVGGAGGKPRSSLNFQISLALEQLAKAELTASKKDDRARLMRLVALTKQKIAKTHELGARTALYQTLGSYESQIAALDAKVAGDAKTAADKKKKTAQDRLAAEKAQHEKELAAYRTMQANAVAMLKKWKQQAAATAAKQREAMQQATNTARDLIGGLFAGPVLNFSDEQRKAALGIPNAATNVPTLTKDLHAQVAQAKAFNKSLAVLKKRGAPTRLLNELLAGGIGNAPEAAALAGASKGDLSGFLAQFAAREKAVRSLAVVARAVTIHADAIVIDGVTYKNPRVQVKQSAAQRRGPVPGRAGYGLVGH